MKEAEKVQLKQDFEAWKKQLADLEVILPEKKSAVYVLQTEEMRGNKKPTELAKAQAELTDLSQKIEAAKDKMAGIKDLIRGEERRTLEDEMAATEAMRQSLSEEEDRFLAEIGTLAGKLGFLLGSYVKNADSPLSLTFTDTTFHPDRRQLHFRDLVRTAFSEAKERAADLYPEGKDFWNRVSRVRNLEILKRSTAKIIQEEIERRTSNFLRS